MNLFSRLRKWATRQDENFTTEALAIVLQTLLDREPSVGLRLTNVLTGGFIDLLPEDVETVEIQTQTVTKHGRPDLEIRTPDTLVVIEVKCDADVRRGQLEGYRRYLEGAPYARKCLVLLTRFPPQLLIGDERPDWSIRWFDLADALDDDLASERIEDAACQYVCDQFLRFLEERNMSIAQVSWQLGEGTRALRNLLSMLQEAANGCQLAARKEISIDWGGCHLSGKSYWLGISMSEPSKLWFQTFTRIDVNLAEKLGEGEIEANEKADGGTSWWRGADLQSEEVHFFARSKIGQIKWLESFLTDCLEKARRIEIRDESAASTLGS